MKRFHYIRIKDVITALSLSNLCFLAAWRSVLSPPDPNGYTLTEYAMWRNSVGLMLDVLLLATLFWASYAFARRRGQERLLSLARWVFLFVAFAALDLARRQFYGPLTAPAFIAVVGKTAFIAILVAAFFLIVFTLASPFTASHFRRAGGGIDSFAVCALDLLASDLVSREKPSGQCGGEKQIAGLRRQ